MCTLHYYWYVAGTISYILISCTAKRRSCCFALPDFWNEEFYKMSEDLEGWRSGCPACAGPGREMFLHFNVSLLFWLSSALCFFPKPLESRQESRGKALAEQDCTVPCLGWQAGSGYLSFSTSLEIAEKNAWGALVMNTSTFTLPCKNSYKEIISKLQRGYTG